MLRYLFLFLFVLCAVPVSAQRTDLAIPENADTVNYPFMKGVLTTAEMAKLHLRPVTLDTATAVFNWYGEKKRFVYETLPAGTVVLVDSLGIVRYKADCGNRLVTQAECPQCLSLDPRLGLPLFWPRSELADSSWVEEPSHWARFWGFMWDAILFLMKLLWGTVLLLALLFAALLLWSFLIREFRNRFSGSAGRGSREEVNREAGPEETPEPDTDLSRAPSLSSTSRSTIREESAPAGRAGSDRPMVSTAPTPPASNLQAEEEMPERSVNLMVHRDGSFVVRATRGITQVQASRFGDNAIRVEVKHE